MEIRKHPACNHTFGPPPDMTNEQCATLPVVLHSDEHGNWASSFWQPSKAELAALSAGGSVMLSIRVGGLGHPVVAVGVTPEKTEAA